MTNLYIHIYISTRLYLTPGFSIRTRSGRGIRLVRISKYTETRVCAFQIIGKTPPPFSFRFVRVYPCEIREYSAPQQGVFTSSSTFYEFVKMKRANPSFPPPLIDANERTFSPLDRDLYTMILQEIFLSKNPPRGRLLDSRSNFSLHFLFPLSLPYSCFRLPREQQDHSNRGERNFRVAMI